MTKIVSEINQIYDTSGFTEKYGHHLYITVIVSIAVAIGVAYFTIMSKIKPIRNNWLKEKCKPNIIPFAGFIYNPDNKSVLEASADNFAECAHNITRDVASYSLLPFNYLLSTITSVFKQAASTIVSMRSVLNQVRNNVSEVTGDITGRAFNIMTPIQKLASDMKSTMTMANGAVTGGIYTLYGSYLSLKSLIGSIISFVIFALIGLVVVILILWAIPFFGWIPAAIATAVYIGISIFVLVVIHDFQKKLNGNVEQDVPELD